jgi:hypothetical protein
MKLGSLFMAENLEVESARKGGCDYFFVKIIAILAGNLFGVNTFTFWVVRLGGSGQFSGASLTVPRINFAIPHKLFHGNAKAPCQISDFTHITGSSERNG